MRQRHHLRTTGQAIVEFALAATVIFFLLAAAVDLGLIFFSVQGLTSAAQEGATYGSRWLVDGPAPSYNRLLNVPEIQKRVRFESGDSGGNGFTNLLDLNSDKIDDSSQPTVIDPTGTTGYIQVRALADTNGDGDPTNDLTGGQRDLCVNPASGATPCYVWVVVKKNHQIVFPLTPAFANQVELTSSYYVLIRDSFAQAGAPESTPVFKTATPVPDAAKIKVNIKVPADGATITSVGQTKFEAEAWDTTVGTTNGSGIDRVVITVTRVGATGPFASVTDYNKQYCLFGGSCSQMDSSGSSSTWSRFTAGQYSVTARAYAKSGAISDPVTVTITRK